MADRSSHRGHGPYYSSPSDGQGGLSVFLLPVTSFPGGPSTHVLSSGLKAPCSVMRLTVIPNATSADATSSVRVLRNSSVVAEIFGPWTIYEQKTLEVLGSYYNPGIAWNIFTGESLSCQGVGAGLPALRVIVEITSAEAV